MPIRIVSNELTAQNKRDVARELEKITDSLTENQPSTYTHMITMMDDLGRSNNKLKKELSYYLLAIYKFLDLPEKRLAYRLNTTSSYLKRKYERQLLGALVYFINPDDVIPDHIAYTGYLDDAHCVNLALSHQTPERREKIESYVDEFKNNLG